MVEEGRRWSAQVDHLSVVGGVKGVEAELLLGQYSAGGAPADSGKDLLIQVDALVDEGTVERRPVLPQIDCLLDQLGQQLTTTAAPPLFLALF
ncbi:hypothetical protein TYRP_008677 [Tyrophagus putrescentiae]|nr:hypothetical protein TYRP_008677 [Tyrophagus putrescentiae]